MADAQEFLKDFPLLKMKMNGKQIAYLDNGATTQKPEQIIKAICGYYGGCNANPHRGAYALSVKATEIYENARARTAKFINAARPEEIIFTKNATEALNLIAYSYGLHNVKAGDEIVISITEHHSNLVPWQFVAKTTGATLKYIYLEKDGNLSDEDIETKITEKTKIVAVTQVSNVLGLKNDVKKIVKKAHSVGAVAIVDGSQSVAHMKVDVRDLDCDFFAFSGHKMLSPMGIGVLYGKYDILDAMPPFLRGGDMIEYVEEQDTTYAELPAKFEAGTQNVGGAAGLTAAIDYLETITFDRIEAIEKDLVDYAL
ncbi:MAG: aminotransferase class V-fold PLP-dependent enzyme, partial [Mitsuokella jalaludinii]|nr:aminotransferase class V-fold PLP-dependent enzyme [Mitsuokella jalaludinii]